MWSLDGKIGTAGVCVISQSAFGDLGFRNG